MTSFAAPGSRTDAPRRGRRALRARATPTAEPWTRRDAGVLALGLGIGAVALVIGWAGTSGTVSLDAQTRWLAVGILAIIVGGVAMVSWLLAGLAAVGALRRGVLADLDRRRPTTSGPGPPPPSPPPGRSDSAPLPACVATTARRAC